MNESEFLIKLCQLIVEGLSKGMTVRNVMTCLYIPFAVGLDWEYGGAQERIAEQVRKGKAK